MKEIIRILKEDLDMAYSSEQSASNSSNLDKKPNIFPKKIQHLERYQLVILQGTGEMRILQKAAVRTSNSLDLPNLKDAPDYHQSIMKRNLHDGSGIVYRNHNSCEQTSYTIRVIVSGHVRTKDSINVINKNAFDNGRQC